MKLSLKLLATILMAHFLAVSAAAENIPIRYGQIPSTIKTVSALHFNLAQRKGLFVREGITLEMIPIDGGAANTVLALNKSTIEIARTATPSLIQDVLKGSDNVAIVGETRHRSIV